MNKKLKPKGRKIYRYKTRFERVKGFFRNSGAVVMTIAGIGVLVFVGYSVGGPIMRFLEEQRILTPPEQPQEEQILPTETTAPAPSEPVQTTATTALAAEPELPEEVQMQAYRFSSAALSDAKALQRALDNLPDGISHVFVPLKTKGGNLYYASTIEEASVSGAVIAAMPLADIHRMITEAGYVPCAVIDTLDDSIYPQLCKESAYNLAGSSERWVNADGKPQLSPFSPLTKAYLCELTEEISGAGFAHILCESLDFPEFSETDLAMLDPRASAQDRGTALAHLLTAMQETAPTTAFYLSVDAQKLLAGKADIFKSGAAIMPEAALITLPEGENVELSAISAKLHGIPAIFVYPDNPPESQPYYLIYPDTSAPVVESTEPAEETESTDTTESTEATASEIAVG